MTFLIYFFSKIIILGDRNEELLTDTFTLAARWLIVAELTKSLFSYFLFIFLLFIFLAPSPSPWCVFQHTDSAHYCAVTGSRGRRLRPAAAQLGRHLHFICGAASFITGGEAQRCLFLKRKDNTRLSSGRLRPHPFILITTCCWRPAGLRPTPPHNIMFSCLLLNYQRKDLGWGGHCPIKKKTMQTVEESWCLDYLKGYKKAYNFWRIAFGASDCGENLEAFQV